MAGEEEGGKRIREIPGLPLLHLLTLLLLELTKLGLGVSTSTVDGGEGRWRTPPDVEAEAEAEDGTRSVVVASLSASKLTRRRELEFKERGVVSMAGHWDEREAGNRIGLFFRHVL